MKNISISAPDKNLNVSDKIFYLEENTHLVFEKISENIFSIHQPEKKIRISGTIIDKKDNTPIAGATIILENGEKTSADKNGFFDIMVSRPVGYKIESPEFITLQVSAIEKNNAEKNIYILDEKIKKIDEVFIQQYISNSISKNKDGSYGISPKKGGIIPGLIEPDVLQTTLFLPGITSAKESLSSINVRSGTNDQNLILWNGIKLYQTGHFFGQISTINPYLSNYIKIFKNGSPAFFGDGVSSVVDISTDANFSAKNKYSFGLNMLNADIYAKVNITKNSFIEVAARKSFTEFLSTPTFNKYFQKTFQNTSILNLNTNENVEYSVNKDFRFYDISTKLVQKIGAKNLLIFDFININDKVNASEADEDGDEDNLLKNTIYQKNLGLNATWKSVWNSKNSSTIQLSNSVYELDSKIENIFDLSSYNTKENKVNDQSLKIDHHYQLNKKYALKFGYQLNKIAVRNVAEDKSVSSFEKSNSNLTEHAIFAEAKLNDSTSKFNASAGIRGNYITTFRKIMVEPRFQLNYEINKNLDLIFLGEMKSQIISQQIERQNDFFGVENRWWILANNSDIPVQRSRQISLGLDYKQNNWLITAETYYKKVSGITTSSQGFQNQFQYVQTSGNYNVKGIELLAQKKINYFLIWSHYNFGQSKYNFPALTPSVFENNFQINHLFALGCNFEKKRYKFALGSKWHSGKPETELRDNNINFSDPDNPVLNFALPNGKPLEQYFQVDASVSYHFKTNHNWDYYFNVSLLNIFNRKNEINEYYKINQESTEIEQVKSFGLSRTINAAFRVSF
ncbi:TonB-dependent receptor [Kaistella sp. G5-32]|uniref:TonB-dependent receptor n=1 Tax=Kaistella gelatinilytica TaxID=2787636 RepID=A0ABS0F9U7_9FLAO|nr:TonB-dependent receptor [Kaistella gelatinilytica]MBF8456491.1 TonB-dependent receptor [Kaistella gelatinilytica]